jgi:hypothetical protein
MAFSAATPARLKAKSGTAHLTLAAKQVYDLAAPSSGQNNGRQWAHL